MRMTPTLGAMLISSLALAAPAIAQDTQDAEVTADTVVARVGDTEFTMGHVLVMRSKLPERVLQLPDDVLLKGIVDQLVDQYLLSKNLEDQGDLPEVVALQLENESRGALASATLAILLQEAVTDEALQAAYDEAYVNVEPGTQYNASHILVATEEEALDVIAKLEGGADFAETAKEVSTGPSGPNGGELPWFGEGEMVPEFQSAVADMEVGSISAPIQTQFGWHVIRLNETRPVPTPTLDEVRPQLAQQIQQAAVESRLDELRTAAAPEFLLDTVDAAALRNDALLAD